MRFGQFVNFPDSQIPTGFSVGYELSQLDSFATIRCYEAGHVTLTLEETKAVVKTASDCIKWVEAYVPI